MLKGLPRNVKLAVCLWLFAFVGMRGAAAISAYFFGIGKVSNGPEFSVAMILAFALLSVLPLWLLWLAAWRRKFWARSLLFMLYLFALFALARHIFGWFGTAVTFAGLGLWYNVAVFAIEGVALLLLCTGDAHPWFWEDPPSEIAKVE
jgi:hypothetical protein